LLEKKWQLAALNDKDLASDAYHIFFPYRDTCSTMIIFQKQLKKCTLFSFLN